MKATGSFSHHRRFSAAAETYEQCAHVQEQVAARLLELAHVEMPQGGWTPILEIGCGSGLLTRRLREIYPSSHLLALDLSLGMLSEARRRVAASSGMMGWVAGDAGHLPLASGFGAVFSSSVLHWADSPGVAMGEIARILNPGGVAFLAMMTAGTLAELHAVRRRIAPDNLPPADLPPPDLLRQAVREAGLVIRFDVLGEIVAPYRSAQALLKTLHEQGLTGGRFSTSGRPFTRTQLRKLIADYDREFSQGEGVYATYRILWLIAEKPTAFSGSVNFKQIDCNKKGKFV